MHYCSGQAQVLYYWMPSFAKGDLFEGFYAAAINLFLFVFPLGEGGRKIQDSRAVSLDI